MSHGHDHAHGDGHGHAAHAHHAHGHGGHDHAHHRHAQAPSTRGDRVRLAVALVLVAGYCAAEVIGGIAANSLALLADAGHMFADAAALALALAAAWIAARPATPRRSYGYHRAEILAALVNGALVIAAAGAIAVEGLRRLRAPPEIDGGLMLAVAIGGLAVNAVALAVLHGGRGHGLNLRAAWLHVVSDTVGSVAAVLGAWAVMGAGWRWADPVLSLLIALLVVRSAWSLVRDAVSVLMESAPRGIDIDAVRAAMRAAPGVAEVHDLHVWSITSGMVALSAHAVVDGSVGDREVLARLRAVLAERFDLHHVTIQVEPSGFVERELHA